MDHLPVTWLRATRVYWAFFWRVIVYLMLPFGAIGFFFGLVMLGNDIPPEKHVWKLQTILLPISLAASVWIMKDVLTSSMGRFRIVLVPSKEESPAQPGIQPDGPASGGSTG